MLSKRFEELKLTGNLPSPTGVGLAILQITQSEDASLDEVVAVLNTDPTLTGRVFKLANSGEASAVAPATTLQQAAMRLGLRAVANVSLGFSLLASNRPGRCTAFDYEGFWSHSLAVASAAQVLAERRGGVPPGEAFTCGLLAGIGRLALASIHPEAYEEVLNAVRADAAKRLSDAEEEAFGTHHRELAAAMLQDWKLPAWYSDAVGFMGGANLEELPTPVARRLAAILQDARDLARALTLRPDAPLDDCRACLTELDRLCERLRLTQPDLDELWNRAAEGWRVWGETVRIPTKAGLGLTDLRVRADGPDESAAAEPAQPAARRAAILEPENAAGGLNVLLVGLDPAGQHDLQNLLERDNHSVLTAAIGREGLACAVEKAPHVVVCDWSAPGFDALEFVRTLRKSELGGRMHILLLADRDKEASLLDAFEDGVDEYILKPFDPRIIRARVFAAQRMVRLTNRVEGLLREREAQVGQLAILTRKLETAALTDPLTGLFNRRYAMERLKKEIALATRTSRPLSIVLLDVDRFKQVNDSHGHDAGDAVLRDLARILRGAVRKTDTPCRLGGEEFLLICPGADASAAMAIAERLRATIAGHVVRWGSFQDAVTISLGVAELDATQPDVDALVKRADRGVYLAKERGRDRVALVDSDEVEGPLRQAG